MEKRIIHVLSGREKKITEQETVIRFLPHIDCCFTDPFIVLHHMGAKKIKPASGERVNSHSRRGFSPHIFMPQGERSNRDKTGNDQVIRAGGVQWMFAGKRNMLNDGPAAKLPELGEIREAIQFCFSVPKEKNNTTPFYQSVTEEQLPTSISSDGIQFRLASGGYNGYNGPIQNVTPIVSMIGEVKKASQVTLNATAGYWTMLYLVKGKISCADQQIEAFNLIVFEKDNNEISFSAEENTQILYLSGEPLDEPMAAKDNFVMNTPGFC